MMNTREHFFFPTEQLESIRREAGRFNEAWTAQEIMAVVELFRNGKRIDEIASMQGRTKNAIKIRLVNEGEVLPYLSRREQEWALEEVDRLGRFHSQGYSPVEIAKLMGRLSRETRDKLVEIGLLPQRERPVRDPEHPNAFMPWPKEETARLEQELSSLRTALAGLARIAKDHGRSVGSIVSRAEKLGLCDIVGA